jgi:hypothetical protein
MTSEKQMQANVVNAQMSTGPVTQEGKAVVSHNALKHGIFAKDLVISAGDGRENELEYHELLAELKKDLAPLGRMEMLFVEKIAVNYWRLRRLVRYETGEIRGRLDDFRESALRSYYSSSYSSQQRQQPEMEYYSYNDDISDTEYQEQLYKVTSIRSSEFNPAEDKAALEYVLYYRLDREKAEFVDADYNAAKKYVAGLSPQLKGKLRREMLEEAEQVLAEMTEVRTWKVKFDCLHKSNSLPLERGLNKIIKYESSLERSIFRNLAALKTLQRNRSKSGAAGNDPLELPAAAGC